jgi:ribosome biogenesis protein Nip4
MLQSVYLHKLKTYDSKVKAMNELRAKVQQIISRKNLQYTRKCDTVQEILEKLKRRFAPSDKARQNEVSKA